jgi:hypothetical protein
VSILVSSIWYVRCLIPHLSVHSYLRWCGPHPQQHQAHPLFMAVQITPLSLPIFSTSTSNFSVWLYCVHSS